LPGNARQDSHHTNAPALCVRATDSVAGCFERRIYTAADANHQSKSESVRPRGRQDNLADQPVADIRIRKLELGGQRHSHIDRLHARDPLIEKATQGGD